MVADPQRSTPRKSPWRTTSSRSVYENPWISVREDQVITPTGTPGIYGVVTKPLALGVVALGDDGCVVLVGQWRYTLDRYSWELVEGAFDPAVDETPLAGIQRELAEEAGLAAASWELLTPQPVALSNSVSDEQALLWVASDLTPAQATTSDPTEQLQLRRLPLAAAVDAAVSGEIDDAMSVLGLLLVDRRRRGR